MLTIWAGWGKFQQRKENKEMKIGGHVHFPQFLVQHKMLNLNGRVQYRLAYAQKVIAPNTRLSSFYVSHF